MRDENRPIAHSLQCRYADSPVLFHHRPTMQPLHSAAEERPVAAPLHLPMGQLWLQAEVAAIREENRPTAHSVQSRYAESPVMFDHRPTSQSLHCTAEERPVVPLHRPMGQL